MKKKLFFWLFMAYAIFTSLKIKAQNRDSTQREDILKANFSQDSFFGFFMNVQATIPLKKSNHSFVMYANYWANPAFANLNTGTDFWTEMGGGVQFFQSQKPYNFLLTLGITSGRVLSGGNTAVMGDGIVPAITFNYTQNNIDLQLFANYFKYLRKAGKINTDYLWTGGYVGYLFSKKISAGFHFEEFYQTFRTNEIDKSLYRWSGLYFQMIAKKRYEMKFISGLELLNQTEVTDFYRISTTFNF
jgi:hypothetical protein